MKVSYSSLHCPHCGAKSFNLINDDVFLCDYCGQKFNFCLEDIDFNSENRIFIDELKEQFNKKISELNYEKKLDYYCLLHYRKLAYPKVLPNIATTILVLTVFMLFVSIFSFSLPAIIGFLCSNVISVPFFIFTKIYCKARLIKYKDYVSLCAEKIVDYEHEINAYTNLLSKLTK